MRILIALSVSFLATTMVLAMPNDDGVLRVDPTSEAMTGRTLTSSEAAELEDAVAKAPDSSSSARLRLLGYYRLEKLSDESVRAAARSHVLWFIANEPESEITGNPFCMLDAIVDPEGYQQGKNLWLEQTESHPKSSLVFGHAANFFLQHDSAQAEGMLKRAQTLDPKNPRWCDKLGQLYSLQHTKGSAAESVAEYEKANRLDEAEESQFYRLDKLAKAAFEADDFEKASTYAQDLLKAAGDERNNWNFGNAIHDGNSVLGRVALKSGDKKQAIDYLLKAGATPGSPQLNSFGPNMSLAKELIAVGERDAVLQYFELCAKFWEMGGERLVDWTKDVQTGKVPDFRANLYY